MIKKQTRFVQEISRIRNRITTLIAGAFAFVTALAWNDAIKEWLKPILSQGEGAWPLTYVAIIVTLISVVVIYGITKANEMKIEQIYSAKQLKTMRR